jgi:hypothetical protein
MPQAGADLCRLASSSPMVELTGACSVSFLILASGGLPACRRSLRNCSESRATDLSPFARSATHARTLHQRPAYRDAFEIVRDLAVSRQCRGTFVLAAVDATASRTGRVTLKLFDTRTALGLLTMLVVAALATSLALVAGSRWPTALPAGGGGAWGVHAAVTTEMR